MAGAGAVAGAVTWAGAGAVAVAEALAGARAEAVAAIEMHERCGLQVLDAQSCGWQGGGHNNKVVWSDVAAGGPKIVPTKGAFMHSWIKGRIL